MVGSRRLETAVDLAGGGWPVVPVHYPVAAIGRGMVGCSCHQVGCYWPARHPIAELGIGDASTDPERVRAWWERWPSANVATFVGVRVEVIDLTYPDLAPELASWLQARGAGDGPVAELPGGQVRFLGSAVPETVRGPWLRRLEGGWVERAAHGRLVLLPPSRVAALSGGELSWRTGPHVALPDGGRLAHALMGLPSPAELRAWATRATEEVAARTR